MNYKELEKKKPEELQKILAEQRAKLQDLRFKSSIGQLKTVRDIRETRKNIARILTRLSQ